MTDKKTPEVQVDAASDAKVPAPEPQTKKQDSVTTTVFVPSGPCCQVGDPENRHQLRT
jgi:hypothetical protein